MSERRNKHGSDDKPQMPRKFEEKINNLRRRNEEDRVQYENLQAELRQITSLNPATTNAGSVAAPQQLVSDRSQFPHQNNDAARQTYVLAPQQQQFTQARMVVANTSGGSVFTTNNNPAAVACNGSANLPPAAAATAVFVPGRRASAAPGAYDNKTTGEQYIDGQQQFYTASGDAGGGMHAHLPLTTITSAGGNYLSVPNRSNQQLLGRSLPDMSVFSMLSSYPQSTSQYDGQQQQPVFQQQQLPQHISQFVDTTPSNFSQNHNQFYSRGTSNGSNSAKSSSGIESESVSLINNSNNNHFVSAASGGGGPVRGVSLSPRRLATTTAGSGNADLRAVSPGAPRHTSPGGTPGGASERTSRHFQRHFSPTNAPYTPAAAAAAPASGSGGHHHHHSHAHRQHPYVSSSMHNLNDAGGGGGGGPMLGGHSRKSVSPSRYMLPQRQSQQYIYSNVSQQQVQYITQQQQQHQQQQQQQMMFAGDPQRFVMMPNNHQQQQQYLLLPPVDSLSGRRTHSDSALHQTSTSNSSTTSGPTTALYYQHAHQPTLGSTTASTFPPPISSNDANQQQHQQRRVSGQQQQQQAQTPSDVASPQRHVVLTSDGYQSVSPPFISNANSDDGDMLIFEADQQFTTTDQQFQQQQPLEFYNDSGKNSTLTRLRDNLPDVSISPPQVHEQQQQQQQQQRQRMLSSHGPIISSAQQQQQQISQQNSPQQQQQQQQQQHSQQSPAYQHMQSSPASLMTGWQNESIASDSSGGSTATLLPMQHLQQQTSLNMSGSLPDLSQHNHQYIQQRSGGAIAATASPLAGASGPNNNSAAGGGGVLPLPSRDISRRSQSGVFVSHHAHPPSQQQNQQLYHQPFGENLPLSAAGVYQSISPAVAQRVGGGGESASNAASSIPDIVIGESAANAKAVRAANNPPTFTSANMPNNNQLAYRHQQHDRYASMSPAAFPDQHHNQYNPPLPMEYSSNNSNDNSCSSYADHSTPPVDARKEQAVSLIRQQLESVSVNSTENYNSRFDFGQPASAPAATTPSRPNIRTDSQEVTLELLGQIAASGNADQQTAAQLDAINVDEMIDFNAVADFMMADDMDAVSAAAAFELGGNFEDWSASNNNSIINVNHPQFGQQQQNEQHKNRP